MYKKSSIFSLCLCLTMTLSLTVILSGCGSPKMQSTDLMTDLQMNEEETEPEKIISLESADFTGREGVAVSDFGVRLFQQSMEEDSNTLISPISILYALAMTENGAKEETLAQMEEVFGLSVTELNAYLSAYIRSLPADDKNKLSIANSIWLKDTESLTVQPDFLKTNARYYNAEIYKAPFDNSTLKEINEWVSQKTDKMIPSILDEIREENIMYLINAITFDAQWQSIYEEYQIKEGLFTKEDGTTKNIELMYSTEQAYLEDDKATGFIKYYNDHKYAFVALLPNEGVSIADYTSTLTGEHLQELLETPLDIQINAAIPKYETEYSIEISDVLKSMGMTDAFDAGTSDFSGIGTSDNKKLYIDRVLHKTYICVDEKGTKAGAVTAVVMDTNGIMEPQETKTVYLNRPFLYLLIDCENKLPLFMGTTMDIDE